MSTHAHAYGLACGPTGQNLFRLVPNDLKKKKKRRKIQIKLRSVALGLVLHSTASPAAQNTESLKKQKYSFMLDCVCPPSFSNIPQHWPHCAQGRFQLPFMIRPDVGHVQLNRTRRNKQTDWSHQWTTSAKNPKNKTSMSHSFFFYASTHDFFFCLHRGNR